jgi:hypothetical protein
VVRTGPDGSVYVIFEDSDNKLGSQQVVVVSHDNRIRQFAPLHCRESDGRNAFRAVAWSTLRYQPSAVGNAACAVLIASRNR